MLLALSSWIAGSLSDRARRETLRRESPLNQLRILVADDHKPLRKDSASCDIVGIVGNGIDLVDQAKRRNLDLIVLDISMPDKGGRKKPVATVRIDTYQTVLC
jgi:CheY-like chemotaxis protein